MDGPEAGTVAGSHVLVEALDSVNTGELTELLVHVVGARARVVSEPDTEVLDLGRLLLGDLENKGYMQGCDAFGQRSRSACLLRAARDIMIHTTLTPMISPEAFLTFFNCLPRFEHDIPLVIVITHTSRSTRNETWRRPH